MDAAEKKEELRIRDKVMPRPAKSSARSAGPVQPASSREAVDRVVKILRTGGDRFRVLVDSIRDYAICLLDTSGHIETWNVGAELVKGYKRDEILGKHIEVFYTPEDRARGLAAILMGEAAANGRVEHEGWRVRKDGTRFWADVVLTALRNESGELIGYAKVTRDLTERRRLEDERLRRARADERFRVIVDSVKDYAIFMLGPTGHIETWNRGAELIKGYQASEVIGKRIDIFYPAEDRERGKPDYLLGLAVRDGRVEDEGWRVRKDGTRFWADVVITALRSEDGSLLGFSKVTRDLTLRRGVEEDLRRSEERFRLLIDSVEDYAIFMLDCEGRVATWNAAAERINGYPASEIIGHHASVFRLPEEVVAGRCERELETARRVGRFEEEGWRVRKDGTRFWANVVLTAIHDKTGELIGYAKVTRDLTERRRLDEERLQRVRAEEALRVRDEFLSIASHELKTPLTSLQIELYGMRERIGEGEGDQRLSRKLDRASRNADRLSGLIDTLLDVSRIATGRLTLKPERFDLAESVHSVVEGMRGTAARAGCELRLEGAPVDDAGAGRIWGSWDRLRIEQVVMNLLSNAFKYGAGQPVTVSVFRDGRDAVVKVSDKGPGVADKDVHRIFDRFERAAPMRHYGGLGLGLYVSREIVRAEHGSIAVHNLPEGGACFEVRLPSEPGRARGALDA
jgi:PAS domain S-box-containing protein